MKFKKASFYIQLTAKYNYDVVERSGWASADGNYGFYRLGDSWTCTDIRTGLSLCNKSTRTECANWVEENLGLIASARLTKKYRTQAESFRKKVKEAIDGKNEKKETS